MTSPTPFAAESECHVSVIDSAGVRHTMTVRAESLFDAVFAANYEQICGHQRHFPKLQRDTEIEVRTPDGRTLRTTFGKAMEWGNREAARWIRHRQAVS